MFRTPPSATSSKGGGKSLTTSVAPIAPPVTPSVMNKPAPFDGNFDPIKHFPPSFLSQGFPRHIETLWNSVADVRKGANVALSTHGPNSSRYQELTRKAIACHAALDAANEHLKNFKVLAPMYRDLFRKFAAAHEGTWHHFTSRKDFVIKITEREVTNKELEEIVDDFNAYEKDLERIQRKFISEFARLKKRWDAIVAMGVDNMGEEVGKAVEELAYEAGGLFLSPKNYTLLLIDRLHALDPLFAEGILWHVVDRYPQAAKLSKLEERVLFKRTSEDDAAAE